MGIEKMIKGTYVHSSGIRDTEKALSLYVGILGYNVL